MSELYSKTREVSRKFGETNDCAVVAISIFLDVSYEEAWLALKNAGRKACSGTYKYQQVQAINDLLAAKKINKKLVKHDVEERFWKKEKSDFEMSIRSKYPPRYNTKNLTIKQIEKFADAWSHIDNALIFISGHVAAFRDGIIHDWSAGRRNHIEQIWVLEDI